MAATPALPEIAGYVEAFTADRVLGWAWGPRQPGLRVAVELRLGSEAVAHAIADQPRADLASSGVGDGNHAFALTIPHAYRSRTAELSVLARAGDGEPVIIGTPPAAEALADQVARMLRGLDALVGSQRVLHRGLQALASPPDQATFAALAAAQTTMAEQFTVLERFVVRLDERLLALLPSVTPAGRAMPPATMWALAVAILALAVGVTGLVHSLGG